MFKLVRDAIFRRGLSTAIQIGTDAATTATSKSFTQVFEITLPATIVVRGSNVTVNIQYHALRRVILDSSLRAFFGWEFVTDQDESGIYIVAKREPLVGALSSASFTITMPPEAHLSLQLTPGDLKLTGLQGKLTIPSIKISPKDE
jgi:hypothetical protein